MRQHRKVPRYRECCRPLMPILKRISIDVASHDGLQKLKVGSCLAAAASAAVA